MKTKKIDSLRDFAGRVGRLPRGGSRSGSRELDDKYKMSPPVKTGFSGQAGPSETITGVPNQKTNLIQGNRAGSDRISGSMEAGGRTPAA